MDSFLSQFSFQLNQDLPAPRRLGKRVLIQREQLDRLTNRNVKIIWPEKRQGKTVRS
jgi:hypothetical protein